MTLSLGFLLLIAAPFAVVGFDLTGATTRRLSEAGEEASCDVRSSCDASCDTSCDGNCDNDDSSCDSSCDGNCDSSCDIFSSCDRCGNTCATATEESIHMSLGHTNCKSSTVAGECCLCGGHSCGPSTNHSGRNIMLSDECPLSRESQSTSEGPPPTWAVAVVALLFIAIPARLFYLHSKKRPMSEFLKTGKTQPPAAVGVQPAVAVAVKPAAVVQPAA